MMAEFPSARLHGFSSGGTWISKAGLTEICPVNGRLWEAIRTMLAANRYRQEGHADRGGGPVVTMNDGDRHYREVVHPVGHVPFPTHA